jgi:hypothetical protein
VQKLIYKDDRKIGQNDVPPGGVDMPRDDGGLIDNMLLTDSRK